MPRISRYNRDTKKLEWVDASQAEYDAWRSARAEKMAATRQNAPAGKSPKGGRSRGRLSPAGASSTTDTLDDAGSSAELGARAAGRAAPKPKATSGPLAPVIGLISRFAAMGLINATAAITRGRHPMTPAEGMSVAVPALRIVDRELGKRVTWKPAGGPNMADIERIGMGVTSWVLRGLAGAQTAPRPAPMTPPAPFPMPSPTAAPDLAAPDDAAPDTADDGGDLFAGSEPVGKAAGPANTPAPSFIAHAGPSGVARNVPDSVWNALSPSEIGLAEVMA